MNDFPAAGDQPKAVNVDPKWLTPEGGAPKEHTSEGEINAEDGVELTADVTVADGVVELVAESGNEAPSGGPAKTAGAGAAGADRGDSFDPNTSSSPHGKASDPNRSAPTQPRPAVPAGLPRSSRAPSEPSEPSAGAAPVAPAAPSAAAPAKPTKAGALRSAAHKQVSSKAKSAGSNIGGKIAQQLGASKEIGQRVGGKVAQGVADKHSPTAAPDQREHRDSALKTGAKVAVAAGKMALADTLAGFTGIPPRIWAMLMTKKALALYAVSAVMPFVLIAGAVMGSGMHNPLPQSDALVAKYIPGGWQAATKRASLSVGNLAVPVPWTVLAGIAKVSTDFGNKSPYDQLVHDSKRAGENITDPSGTADAPVAPATSAPAATPSTTPKPGTSSGTHAAGSNCEARASDPPIGGKTGQGVGPFLLTPSAATTMEDQGLDPNDPCDAAMFLARSLSEAAFARVQSGATSPYAGKVEFTKAAKFWAAVISDTGLVADPTSTSCGLDPLPGGQQYGVPFLIEQIWKCQADRTGDLHVVKKVSGTATKPVYEEYDQADAVNALVSEALQVSYGFGKWDLTKCNDKAELAGVFPISKKQAADLKVTNRCDAQQSVSAAARIVMSVERIMPAKRVQGFTMAFYAPMIGGWESFPSVFGPELADLKTLGPAQDWEPSKSCATAVARYVTALEPNFTKLAYLGHGGLEVTVLTITPELDKAKAATKVPSPETDPSCMNAPRDILMSAVSDAAQDAANSVLNAAEVNPVPTTPTPSPSTSTPGLILDPLTPPVSDPDEVDGTNGLTQADKDKANRLSAISNVYRVISDAAAPADAVYGKASLVGPRLARTSANVPVGDLGQDSLVTEPDDAASRATDYAIFFGGVVPPFDTALKRVGSLVDLTQNTSGGGVGLNSAGIPAKYVPLIIAAGQRCPALGVTPALIAAQLKQESGFNPKAVSPSGAQGIGQFMPGTWAARGTDGNGDGTKDVWNPEDAIASTAKMDCEDIARVKKIDGVKGDPVDLMLAAYNAGMGAVSKYKGIPPYKETQGYVKKIRAYEAQFAAGPAASTGGGQTTVNAQGCPTSAPSGTLRKGAESFGIAKLCANSVAKARSPQAANAVKWAMSHLGIPYSQPRRNSPNWADCSSFVSRAYTQGAGVNIAPKGQNAPTTGVFPAVRWMVQIPYSQVMPGDLVEPFPGHVTMQLSNGFKVHTNRTGDVSHITTAYSSAYWTGWVNPAKV